MPFDMLGLTIFVPSASNFIPYIPPTIVTDYDRVLHTKIPNVTYTFDIRHDWYAVDIPENLVRGMMYAINWKQAINNADNTDNLRVSLDCDIQKGDILLRDDGRTLLCIWAITEQINNKKTQAQLCNYNLEVFRNTGWQIDKDGKRISDSEYTTIAPEIPCICSNVTGKYEYVIANYIPGVLPDNIANILMQYNTTTDKIMIGDLFLWHRQWYTIKNIERTQLDVAEDSGILILNCEKMPGEQVVA